MNTSGASPADSLLDEHKAANDLLQILRREQTKLVEANINGLAELTEEKAKIVAHMTWLASSRHRALASAGFEAKETGMQAWLLSDAGTSAARQTWTELLAIAQSGKELNRTNGLLINRHMARNQNALNVLQGNPQNSNFYGPNGQATGKTTTRGLVIG